jgi:hypothetical protein
MKTLNNSTVLKGLALSAMVLGLGACGDEKTPVVVTPPPTVTTVTPPANNQDPNFDIVLSSYIPQLQSIYGDIRFLDPVTIFANGGSVTIPAGTTISWINLYQQYVVPMMLSCGCFNDVGPLLSQWGNYGVSSGFQGWANLNYGDFDLFLSGSYGSGPARQNWINVWTAARVQFTRFGQFTTFRQVYSMLSYSQFTYYTQYYYQVYYYNYYQTYIYPVYNPYWGNPWLGGNWAGGGFNYNSGSGWNINFGAIFNF